MGNKLSSEKMETILRAAQLLKEEKTFKYEYLEGLDSVDLVDIIVGLSFLGESALETVAEHVNSTPESLLEILIERFSAELDAQASNEKRLL